ncbi:MAG: helix-hairpin-helix domain-containing protein [Burkholderiaceae bacterium]
MNPFTESTVARPWAENACAKSTGPSPAATWSKRRRRSLAGLALGMLAGSVSMHGLAFAIDVNAATQEQLRELRGIGPKTAQVIVEERARGGRYESLDDLADRVKGIGPKKAAALQASGLTVGAGSAFKKDANASTPASASTTGKALAAQTGKAAKAGGPVGAEAPPSQQRRAR